MKFRGILLSLVLLAATSLSAASRPNVVLFLVDDMGWMDSTPYGSKYYETPNMAKLAKQATLFTDAAAALVKVNFAFNAMHGLAKLAKFTTASLRIDDVQFTADFTQATVKTAHVDAKSPSGWKPFPKP